VSTHLSGSGQVGDLLRDVNEHVGEFVQTESLI